MERKTLLNENSNLVQSDEQRIVDFLRERNLDKVNRVSKPVTPRNTVYTRHIKRLLDLVIAIPAFAFFLPLNILFGICTLFDVGIPIFYRQLRVGLNGIPFQMVKFRNMSNKSDDEGNLLPAKERVTRFGYFMRSHSFDELLNFWNVIKGDMSIIGPRPLPVFFHERMSERHKMRSAVRPGLECPRIIEVEGEQYNRQFENDVWYVENVSLYNDVRLIIRLVKMTILHEQRLTNAGGGTYFVGYDDFGRAIPKRVAIELYKDYLN